MRDVPPARLAEIVPQRWEETRRRVEAVRRLLSGPDQSTSTILRYAAELGVSRQMMYKLLALVRAWDADADRPADPMRKRSADREGAMILEQAIAELGGGAAAAQVRERAAEIAAAQGIDPPSRSRVVTALGRRPAGAGLAKRLKLDAGLIVDAAPLAVTLAATGIRRSAVLTCVFDGHDGALRAWTVTDGAAGAARIGELATCAGVGIGDACGMAATSAVTSTGIPGPPNIARARVRAGAVMRAALGSAVGRIRLLPQDASGLRGDPPLVSLDDLGTVLCEFLPRDAEVPRRSD